MSKKTRIITREEFEKFICCMRKWIDEGAGVGPTGPTGDIGVPGPAGEDGFTGPTGPISEAEFNLYSYETGGAIVIATGEGVVFDTSGGTGTITVPEDVFLLSFIFDGSLSDLGSGDYTLFVNYDWQPTTGLLMLANMDIVERSTSAVGGPSTGLPFSYIGMSGLNLPRREVVNRSTTSTRYRIKNLDSYANWTLKMTF